MLNYPLTQYMFCAPDEGAAAVVMCRQVFRNEHKHAQRYCSQNPTGKCVHRGLQKIILSGPLTNRFPQTSREQAHAASLLIRLTSFQESNFRAVHRIVVLRTHMVNKKLTVPTQRDF